MSKAIELRETRRGVAICETTPRYDVLLNGVFFDQLFYNIRGYVGYLPLPDGSRLSMPECGISAFKKEIVKLNREFAVISK